MHAHAITLPPPFFYRLCCMLRIMSRSKPSAYIFLPIILVQVDLGFICPKNAVPELGWLFFRYCLAESNLAFLFLRLMNGLHLVVNLCICSSLCGRLG
ncbi:hypothetical protein FKM82_029205 [Ascaphus truei]